MTSGVLGKRFDGAELSIPESRPGESQIPESFAAVEIPWKEERVAGYQSETLPYTLYWLSEENGASGFYLFDEELSVFVPYLRTHWSSRYFVFSVLVDKDLPTGFELSKAKIWGSDVPVYKPLSGDYVSKAYLDAFMNEDDSVDRELPGQLYLLALRMNDSENKYLYFYDATLDSLIRADLWLVPVAGSILDKDPEPEPTVTDPPEPLPTESQPLDPDEEDPASVRTVTLSGYSVPLAWLIGLGVFILLLLAAVLWLAVLLFKARCSGNISSPDPDEEASLYHVEESSDPPLDFPIVGGTDEADESLPAEDGDADQPADTESGWTSLEETLKRIEEKRGSSNEYPAGLNPVSHRRPERDDPEDTEEL